jgi:glucose/arabinose dehydrogenase
MTVQRPNAVGAALAFAALLAVPAGAGAATVANPLCENNTAFFGPKLPPDITLPAGYTATVFASGLNQPTGIAFTGDSANFQVYVLESGHGLPSVCNEQSSFGTGDFDPNNPFTPDILVYNSAGKLIRGPLGKPNAAGTGFQAAGPAVDIAFEKGLAGGRLFATDSNQATHTHNGQNNSSRIVTVDPTTGKVTPFIVGLPTGDHPTEQLAFHGKWIYWSQGSTTNSGVVGRDNGGGQNQSDIPCQTIKLSQNVFDSGGGVNTSGYSPFGVTQPGATIPAFFNSFTGKIRQGVCDGATLRAQLSDPTVIQPVAWGHRNGYAIRFAPDDHPLAGSLVVGEDGADERGARPSNGAPEVLSIDAQNRDGSPGYHGWPDRYGFLPSSQAVFNPVGGVSDDLCVPDPSNPPSGCTPASLALILKEDVPMRDVLAGPPQQITAPIALEAADSSFTGIDFAPESFAGGPVHHGAALYSLEGDFGFSAPNANPPAPEVGHEVKLINFKHEPVWGDDSDDNERGPVALSFQNFARNETGDQAFVTGINGFNRPTDVRFGPDGCAYVVDYGAVRDLGSDSHFVGAANGPLVQIPGTGVVWKICPE